MDCVNLHQNEDVITLEPIPENRLVSLIRGKHKLCYDALALWRRFRIQKRQGRDRTLPDNGIPVTREEEQQTLEIARSSFPQYYQPIGRGMHPIFLSRDAGLEYIRRHPGVRLEQYALVNDVDVYELLYPEDPIVQLEERIGPVIVQRARRRGAWRCASVNDYLYRREPDFGYCRSPTSDILRARGEVVDTVDYPPLSILGSTVRTTGRGIPICDREPCTQEVVQEFARIPRRAIFSTGEENEYQYRDGEWRCRNLETGVEGECEETLEDEGLF